MVLTFVVWCVCVACAASGPPCGSDSGEEQRGWHTAEKTSELAGAVSEWKIHSVPNCCKYLNTNLAELGASFRIILDRSSTDLVVYITLFCLRTHASMQMY